MGANPPGTEGYAENADWLIGSWQALSFNDKPSSVRALVPTTPSLVLDVGAGIGTDAAALAALGHRVVAVEPVTQFLATGQDLHRARSIEWVQDHLPGLHVIRARQCRFDLISLSAVWMHLDQAERASAFPCLAELLAPSGRLVLSTRHGPIPAGRRMFDVQAQETIQLAERFSLTCLLNITAPSVQPVNQTAGVTWRYMAFEKR